MSLSLDPSEFNSVNPFYRIPLSVPLLPLCYFRHQGPYRHNGRDTGLTAVRNIGVSALEDGRDTRLPAVGNDGVSTLEDGTDAELTTVGNNGVSTLGDGRETELTSVACLPWRMVQIPSSRR